MRRGYFEWTEKNKKKLAELWRYGHTMNSLQKYFHVGRKTILDGMEIMHIEKKRTARQQSQKREVMTDAQLIKAIQEGDMLTAMMGHKGY